MSYLDHIPAKEQKRLRQKLRSPAEYERLREKVKGPEDLEHEMERMEHIAEASFHLETQPQQRSHLQEELKKALQEHPERTLDGMPEEEVLQALQEGKFTLAVREHPQKREDTFVLIPEGNVTDVYPISSQLSDQYVSQLLAKGQKQTGA